MPKLTRDVNNSLNIRWQEMGDHLTCQEAKLQSVQGSSPPAPPPATPSIISQVNYLLGADSGTFS